MVDLYLSRDDSDFLCYLRGGLILIIVFGHCGGFWLYRPYSEFLHFVVPAFFFISGAVSLFSYKRQKTIWAYLKKRFLSLLVPYYLICSLSLLVYFLAAGQFPALETQDIVAWLTIRPSTQQQGFNIGQVWFLHSLAIITLLSPIYFAVYDRCKWLLLLPICVSLILASIQLIIDCSDYFLIFGHNLYKPIVHSFFWLFGMVYFTSGEKGKTRFLLISMIFSIILSVVLVALLALEPDWGYHTFAPDLYYVAGSYGIICALLLLKKQLVYCVEKLPIVLIMLRFLYQYTFAIYLLHTLPIWVTHELFGWERPGNYVIIFGLIKLVFVMILTCIMAVPFERVGHLVIKWCDQVMETVLSHRLRPE